MALRPLADTLKRTWASDVMRAYATGAMISERALQAVYATELQAALPRHMVL